MLDEQCETFVICNDELCVGYVCIYDETCVLDMIVIWMLVVYICVGYLIAEIVT